MVIFVEKATAEKDLDIRGVSTYVILAKPGQGPQVEDALRKICSEHGLLFQSAETFRGLVNGIKNGITGGLWVLLVLAFTIAAFGIVNTLTMNVIEQTRELAILRVVAMTRWQIRKTILCEAAIMGLMGLLPGAIIGAGIGYLMDLDTSPVAGQLVAVRVHPAPERHLLCDGVSHGVGCRLGSGRAGRPIGTDHRLALRIAPAASRACSGREKVASTASRMTGAGGALSSCAAVTSCACKNTGKLALAAGHEWKICHQYTPLWCFFRTAGPLPSGLLCGNMLTSSKRSKIGPFAARRTYGRISRNQQIQFEGPKDQEPARLPPLRRKRSLWKASR